MIMAADWPTFIDNRTQMYRMVDCARYWHRLAPLVSGLVVAKRVLSTTVRALRFTRCLDGQKHLGMRIPQVHARHRTRQGQILRPHLVFMLCVSRN